MMGNDLNNGILQEPYQLQRQHLESSQVVDRHHRPLTTTDHCMAVFSVQPPQLPSAGQASMMSGRRSRLVSCKLFTV